ncbi:MAG: hypothetical protein COA88_12970 [Kordia sp.]|nr:MAG: hypothetical protein COA88_12970 [Kordia sp.]
MKKVKKIDFKKFFIGSVLLLSASLTNAQSFNQSLNTGLSDYFVPIVALLLVFGVFIGAIRNWDEINDKHTRKQGFINMAMILIYAIVVIAAIAAAIYIGQNLSIQI